jgi:hypothetical protein
MFDLGTFTDLIKMVDSVLDTIRSWVQESTGTKRMLLLELESNIELILSYGRSDLPINSVIAKLETKEMEEALKSGFDVNSLKRTKVSPEVAGEQSQYKRYVGWTTEKLFSNIVVKIRDLKTTVEMDPENVKIRKRVRLINILKLMLLLTKHINS